MYDELKEAAEALLRAHAAAQRDRVADNYSRSKSDHIKIAEHEIAIGNELIAEVEREIASDYD